jgi:hypothetical protein
MLSKAQVRGIKIGGVFDLVPKLLVELDTRHVADAGVLLLQGVELHKGTEKGASDEVLLLREVHQVLAKGNPHFLKLSQSQLLLLLEGQAAGADNVHDLAGVQGLDADLENVLLVETAKALVEGGERLGC